MAADPSFKAKAVEIAHRTALLHQSEEEICTALRIQPPELKSIMRSACFKEIFESCVEKSTDKAIEKAEKLKYGSLEAQYQIRRSQGFNAYMRNVRLAEKLETGEDRNDKLLFEVNKWLAQVGGIVPPEESTVRTQMLTSTVDPETQELFSATMKQMVQVKQVGGNGGSGTDIREQ